MNRIEPTTASESTDVVLCEVNDGVALLTLNRPERHNAWTGTMESRYFDLLEASADDEAVRVIVVTGAGRSFCPGADTDDLQAFGQGVEIDAEDRARRLAFLATRVPKPVIAAINGACAGIGLVHALMCDVRFAAAGAKFTTAFTRRGLVAEHGSSWLLPRLIGVQGALDLLLSARVFTAEEAEEMGVVRKVFPKESLLEDAMAYARDLAENCSPVAMATAKRQIWQDLEKGFEESIHDSNRLMVQSLEQEDFREGVASFVEKRPPEFRPLPPGSKGYV